MYQNFAGSDWPSYDNFLNGKTVVSSKIQKEIDQFVAVAVNRYGNLNIGNGEKVADENRQRQGQIFVNKTLATKQRCQVPWNTMGINSNGEVFICSSPSWIPQFVGNLIEANDVFDVLNSDTARKIRQEIVKGRYYYCNNKLCNFFGNLSTTEYVVGNEHIPLELDDTLIETKITQIPANLIFDFDYTCNFKCPSCRTEVINWNQDFLRRPINDQIVDRIKKLIIDKIEHQKISIRWAGGEPFMSEAYLDLFEYIIASGKTNIQNIIQTNGSNLNGRVVKMLLPYIEELRISFDAGTEPTYNKIRVNGNWNKLLDNVKYIVDLKKQQQLRTKITADFVVQLENYQEIPKFVALCKLLGIENINLQKMWNWGTWDTEEFKKNNVYDRDHKNFTKLKQYFKMVNIPIKHE